MCTYAAGVTRIGQVVYWFMWFTVSVDSLVQMVHGSLVQMVHWFRWFTGSDGSLVQMDHWFRWITAGGSLPGSDF